MFLKKKLTKDQIIMILKMKRIETFFVYASQIRGCLRKIRIKEKVF
ncbi:conserved hypothetical protein (plasmid) [Borreliella garinii PBr]|uniref:Uncharacterized protein n=1 Tax=Borreliella garinii PBr TaxID=498743 RepID=B8F0R3_BORGR|nr:conserved hypothetical protein [Borreliella garinii PBr]